MTFEDFYNLNFYNYERILLIILMYLFNIRATDRQYKIYITTSMKLNEVNYSFPLIETDN